MTKPPAAEKYITLSEYLARLAARAAKGDQAAAREIQLWKRYRTGRLLRSVP